jgi:SAM-dependent methyltransferase
MSFSANTTFRDPAGSVSLYGDRVLRTVYPAYVEATRNFLRSPVAKKLESSGRLVKTVIRGGQEPQAGPLLLSHSRVFFPSYPWEWTPAQWCAAAELTLDICEAILDEGWILKDATPLNILFQGPNPTFVDVLSFERREPSSAIWYAYGQFVRTFLLPLLAYSHLGWPLAATLLRRDSYEPSSLYCKMSWRLRLHPRIFWPVTLPVLLDGIGNAFEWSAMARNIAYAPAIARAVLQKTFHRLHCQIRKAAKPSPASHWTLYTTTSDHYSKQDREQKHAFAMRVFERLRPTNVLDIGANTGEYSILAAQCGAQQIVASDTDEGSVEQLWLRSRSSNLPILPLVVDFARPTPASGWENEESLSFLERAEGRFDVVLLLGVLHHLQLSDQIPIERIAALSARLTRQVIVAEWISTGDPMFRALLRGRDAHYGWLNEQVFLAAFRRWFRTVERQVLPNGRVLYLFEKVEEY